MKKTVWLSKRTYGTILKNSVLCTADPVVVRNRGRKREFFLGKRADRPSRGCWFIFGGRQAKGETLANAAKRNLKRELGVSAKSVKFLGYLDFRGVNNQGILYHTSMHIFLAELPQGTEVHPNGDHSSFKWFSEINPRWPSVVRKALILAGFKYRRRSH